MSEYTNTANPPTLRDYLGVLTRRRWLIGAVIALMLGGLVAISARSPHRYAASAEVLLRKGSQTQGGAPGALRAAKTEADLARVPTVAERALSFAKVRDLRPQDLLRNSTVTPGTDTDILAFRVVDSSPQRAEALATAYARGYTSYRRQLDVAALARARASVTAELRAIQSRGGPPAVIKTLKKKAETLQVAEALRPDTAAVVSTADQAQEFGPNLVRRGILGAGAGIILGILLAFVMEALDTRVRFPNEVAQRLRLPLLARLPRPARALRTQLRPAMLDDPHGSEAEAYRVLRTNLDFFNIEHGARSVMITSAGPNEGKTTTTANLAVVLARAGRRVIAVDLDLRRPLLDMMFAVSSGPGVTDVLLGRVPMERALVGVPLIQPDDGLAESYPDIGTLEVMPAGSAVRNVGELVGSRALTELLQRLQSRADVVIVDGPPLLGAGDGIALMRRVDALILATRLNELRRPMLEELEPLLENAQAVRLGFVATGASFDGSYVRVPVPGAGAFAQVPGD